MSSDPFKATKDFLDGIVAVKAPSVYLPDSASGPGVFRNSIPRSGNSITGQQRALPLRILRRAGVRIPPPLTEIYEQEQVSRVMGARLVKSLVNASYMQVYQYHPPRRGGAMRIPRVPDPGWLELSQLGTERPEPVLGGSWEHDLCGKVLGAIGQRQNYRPSYEVPIGLRKDVRIDVVLEAVNRIRLYCQCCFSDASREAETAIKALSIIPAEAGRLVMVCRDKGLASALSRLLTKADGYEQFHDRISIKIFGDVLENYYKKSGESVVRGRCIVAECISIR
jgi:hypothetical protein